MNLFLYEINKFLKENAFAKVLFCVSVQQRKLAPFIYDNGSVTPETNEYFFGNKLFIKETMICREENQEKVCFDDIDKIKKE